VKGLTPIYTDGHRFKGEGAAADGRGGAWIKDSLSFPISSVLIGVNPWSIVFEIGVIGVRPFRLLPLPG